MIFNAKPALIISGILNLLEPKTIALGGVATGNMNAQLAANTTGIVSDIGNTPMEMATAPTTGKKVLVVATLEVISVKNIIKVATHSIRIIGGTDLRTDNPSPIHRPRPEDPICAASERPPPNNTRSPHGSLLA